MTPAAAAKTGPLFEQLKSDIDKIMAGTEPESYCQEAQALAAVANVIFTQAMTLWYPEQTVSRVNTHLARIHQKHVVPLTQSTNTVEQSKYDAYHQDYLKVHDILGNISPDTRASLDADNAAMEISILFEKILIAAKEWIAPLDSGFVADSPEAIGTLFTAIVRTEPRSNFVEAGLEPVAGIFGDTFGAVTGTLTTSVAWLWKTAFGSPPGAQHQDIATRTWNYGSQYLRQFYGLSPVYDPSREDHRASYNFFVRYILTSVSVIGLGLYVYHNVESRPWLTAGAVASFVAKNALEAASNYAQLQTAHEERIKQEVEHDREVFQASNPGIPAGNWDAVYKSKLATTVNPALDKARAEDAYFNAGVVRNFSVYAHSYAGAIYQQYATLRMVTRQLMVVGTGAEMALRYIVERVYRIGNRYETIDDEWIRKHAKRNGGTQMECYLYANTVVGLRILTALPDAILSLYPAFWLGYAGEMVKMVELSWEISFISGILYQTINGLGYGVAETLGWLCDMLLGIFSRAVPGIGPLVANLVSLLPLTNAFHLIGSIVALVATLTFTVVWATPIVEQTIVTLRDISQRPGGIASMGARDFASWDHVVEYGLKHRRQVFANWVTPISRSQLSGLFKQPGAVSGKELWDMWKYHLAAWKLGVSAHYDTLTSPAMVAALVAGAGVIGYIERRNYRLDNPPAALALEGGDAPDIDPKTGRRIRRPASKSPRRRK